ncbi:hypothetical protein KJ693_12650 [bacterium]|nr:hypothetical protein [bacterium]MBU1616141.1 hypothetical protein [bacterium]
MWPFKKKQNVAAAQDLETQTLGNHGKTEKSINNNLKVIIEEIQKKLKDPDGNIRTETVYSLAIPPRSHVVPSEIRVKMMASVLRNDDYVIARSDAAKAISRWASELRNLSAFGDNSLLDDKEVVIIVPVLIEALSDTGTVPSCAAEALGHIGSKAVSAVPALIHLLESKDIFLQLAASDALKMITGEDLGQDLSKWQNWWDKNKSSVS